MGTDKEDSEIKKVKRLAKQRSNMHDLDELALTRLGLHWPRQKPSPTDTGERNTEPADSTQGALGTPLDIRQTASLIGCSVWTVRQRLIPSGLPCFRSRPSGRMIFYTNQVIRWIQGKQQRRITRP